MTEFRLHGPPGTGKTRALAESWAPKAAHKFGSDRVVICSLTRTAASEIASRDLPIPKENIGTLHALAYRALDRPTIAEGELKDWNEREPAFRLGVGKASVEEPENRQEQGSKGDELATLAGVYRHNRVPIERWREDVRVFQRHWDAWLEEEDLIDFTGLIEQALEGVETAPNDPAVFIVDEAQDSSVLELDLVRKWNRSAEYACLAGDGDQAIYGWRGASARAFLDPKIPEENNYHLTQSYRVPVAVHEVAAKWIQQASYRYAVEYLPRECAGDVSHSQGNSKNVVPLLAEVTADLSRGKTVMILATCGYMLRGIIGRLRNEGVPFHNPYREAHGGWNPLRGGAGRLLAYLRPDSETYPEGIRLWNWTEARTWTDVLRAKDTLRLGGKTAIRRMAQDEERASEIISAAEGERIFGPSWDELKQVFGAGDPLPWFVQRLLGSRHRMMEYALSIAEKRGRQALREEPKLIVGTVHSVKGGQADCVYLLPDLSPSGIREWMRPGDGRDGIIRTIYVGMTRARERLVLGGRWSPSSVDWRC